MFIQIFVYSIIRYFVSPFFLERLWQESLLWIYTQGISMLVSSWIQRRILWKGYESKSTLEMNLYEIFSDFQCWYDNCSLVAESGVNLSHCIKYWILESKKKFFTIFYWACVMYSSFARLYILVLFCFGLSACLLFFCFVFCICICFWFLFYSFIFFNLPWMFDAFLWQNKSSSYVCRVLNIVTARRAQK